MDEFATQHIPVLAEDIVQWLRPAPGKIFVDGTLGGGGHTLRLAEAVRPSGLVLALDRDLAAVDRAHDRLAHLPVRAVHANYADLPEVLADQGLNLVDGILLDLGFSSDQLTDHARGFSFHSPGPLDLRYDVTRGEPAWKLLERLSAQHLADLIYQFGEERLSRRIGRAVVERRRKSPVRTAAELSELVRRVVPRSRAGGIDPATRTFQALRIAVNDELKWLETALRRLPGCLNEGGRLAVISFHSLEDRRVKEAYLADTRVAVLTKRPVRPGDAEVEVNPRARSAKLRVAERRTRCE